MEHFSRHRHLIITSSILIAGILALGLSIGSQLSGQVSQDVEYKMCYVLSLDQWARHHSCGIESQLAQSSSSVSSDPVKQCLDDNGQLTTDRSRCADVQDAQKVLPDQVTKPLTPEEDRRVIETLDNRFGEQKRLEELQSLDSAAKAAIERMQVLLATPVFQLSPNTRQQITKLIEEISELRTSLAQTTSYSELKQVRKTLGTVLMEVAELSTQANQNAAQNGQVLESIVTRVDGLVAQVGTVIGTLENERQSIPREIEAGYEKAKRLVTEAKRTCSMRRPRACGLLHIVLDEIGKLSEPLCRIESKSLTFCG